MIMCLSARHSGEQGHHSLPPLVVAKAAPPGGEGGHAYTIWYVIFKAPDMCSGGVCNEDDIFVGGHPMNGFNAAQIVAARVSVVFGSAGSVANPSGRVKLDGGLTEGVVPGGPAQVVIGLAADDALVPLGVVTGLENTGTAEVHIVLQDHGPAHDDPAQLEMQLTRFMGACNLECADVQVAVHMP